MAILPDSAGIKRGEYPGNPKTLYDSLPFFGGRKVGDVESSEVCRELIKRNVPGIAHTNGREENLRAYSAYLDKLGADAANDAINAWLAA